MITQLGKWLTAIAASMLFPLVAAAADMQLELALSCSGATSAQNKLMIATAGPMIELTGLHACIDKTTRVTLTATGIRTYRNRFHAEAVELALTPVSSAQWMELQKTWLGKEFVVMSGHRSIIYSRVFHEQTEENLTFLAKDEPEAKQIAAALTGEADDAKSDGN